MRAAGVEVVVPLVSQGELIGVLNLGPTAQRAAVQPRRPPAARQPRRQRRRRDPRRPPRARPGAAGSGPRADRPGAEGRAAHPAAVPPAGGTRAGRAGASFRTTGPPARWAATSTTSSRCPEGRIGLVVGDVTDKGVPAAMVMATTHSILRTDAPRLVDPGAVLSRANDLLCAEMPPNMFVTCLYAVLDPATGHLRFANAGHNLPCIHTADGVVEPRATGMPLGLMPGLDLRGAGGHDRAGRARCSSTATGSSRRTTPTASSTASRGSARWWAAPLRVTTWSATCSTTSRRSPARRGSRRTTSRWCRSREPRLSRPPRSAPTAAHPLTSFEVASDLGNERIAADRVVDAVAPPRPAPPARGPAPDRGRRGDHERDRARQRLPIRGAGRPPRGARRRAR